MKARIWCGLMLASVSAAVVGAEPETTNDAASAAAATSVAEGEREATSAPTASSPQSQTGSARRGTSDRLELDTTVVTGNRELPKVLYIVPWKKADLGDLPAQPFNTLLDEVLTPVDRDVFRREVTYYDAVQGTADATQSTSSAQP